MSFVRLLALTSLAMIAFAGNSLLCRFALRQTSIDPASFTTVRLVSGAITLWLVVRFKRRNDGAGGGTWRSAMALFAYAAGFSFAYETLTAATGALLLFGAVQATMIGHAVWTGEKPGGRQLLGVALALAGLIGLLLPGISAPPLNGTLLMLCSGAAWGIYSLRGKGTGDATTVTSGNFLRAAAIGIGLSVLTLKHASVDAAGIGYAVASGALASGIGYAIWYTALPWLGSTTAATVQLSVPMIAALGGVVLLGEHVTLRLALASVAILGGIAAVTLARPARNR
ncbi:MAG TPA: DMT family transporter [Burkholderiales bacterium]|nr:DMT family transporter [Burkholderiales bacterium]